MSGAVDESAGQPLGQKVETLQRILLSGLRSLQEPQKDGSLALSALETEMETLIRTAIVAVNQSHRHRRLVWDASVHAGRMDRLRVETASGNTTAQEGSRALAQEYGEILGYINWLHGFRLQFQRVELQAKELRMNRVDELRNAEIDRHLATASSQDSAQDSAQDTQGSCTVTTARDTLLSKTKKLTNSLMKSNSYLQSSILQSDLNLDELKQQTTGLVRMEEKYSQFETVFNKTASLVKSLERASNQEKRDVYMALGFLSLAISWVVWRRIFKGPVKLALWLLFKFFKGILLSVGVVKRINHPSGARQSTPLAIATTTIPTATDTLEQAVAAAVSRILDHDEL